MQYKTILTVLLVLLTLMSASGYASPDISKQASLESGIAAFEADQYELAYTKLAPLAEGGNPIAQNTLGRMYSQGLGVKSDSNKALQLFQKAAAQGLANAQNNLGVMYASGEAVRQDYQQAIRWFKMADSQNFLLATNNLAEMYENGVGVKPDQVEADKLRKKSQHQASLKDRDLVTIKTVGADEYDQGQKSYYRFDFVNAAAKFSKAADMGHAEAQLRLASMYRLGQGVDKDEKKADFWAKKAADQSHDLDDGRDRVFLIDTSTEEGKRLLEELPKQPVIRSRSGDLDAEKRRTSN